MNIEMYPRNAYFTIIESIRTNLGSYTNASWGDLSIAHIRVFHKNANPYEFNLRLAISAYQNGPVIHTSDWFKFSNEVTGQVEENWLGDIIFTFPEYPLIDNDGDPETYYFSMESQFYTPDGVGNYLAVWCDWMQPVGNSNSAGSRIAIGVKR
jgi:hypothetical protein